MKLTLAHISDLHIGHHSDLYDLYNVPRLKAWRHVTETSIKRLKFTEMSYGPLSTGSHRGVTIPHLKDFIKKNGTNICGLLISGDIARTGVRRDLSASKSILAAFDAIMKERNPSQPKVVALPGNHDRWSDESANAGCCTFEDELAEYWSEGINGVKHTILKNSDNLGPSVHIICGDFCLQSNERAESPTKINRYGQGRVEDSTLDKMISYTECIRKDYQDAKILWAVHFTPMKEGDPDALRMKLIDQNKLIDAAELSRIQIIFSGHLHRAFISRFGSVNIISAGTASFSNFPPQNEIHLIQISYLDDRVLLQRANFVFNQEYGGFDFKGYDPLLEMNVE